jgi:hypothetical protein
MKYTIFKIEDLDCKKSFISAYRGDRDIKDVRIQNKQIVNNIGKNIKKELLIIVNNKEEAENYLKNINDTSIEVLRIDKRILVKDKDGKLLKVYKDNPKYISGELISINKNKVSCKDENGNNLYIDKDIFLSNKYKGVMKGRVTVKDKDGNTFSVNKNDPRYLNGDVIFISKNRKFKKQKQKRGFKQNNYNNLRQKNIIKRNRIKYPNFKYDIKTINGKYFIENFCEHGNLIIEKNKFKNIYNINQEKLYCDKCKKISLNNKKFDDDEITDLRNKFIENSKKDKANLLYKKHYLYNYFPYTWKIISEISEKFNIAWIEACYFFKHNLNNIPICNYKNCNENVKFSTTAQHYNSFCEKHSNNNYSLNQKEIYDFITKHYNGKIFQNLRNLIKGELDIYIPEKNLAIEFNGVYWHSDQFKEKNYHFNKWKQCKDKEITLLTIWEDNWTGKQEIVKSIIKNKLGIIKNKINARDCKIVKISYNETKEFLNNNHLQGWAPSKINLGLFYNNKLVSLMTFGNRRRITQNKSKEGYYELIRFCNKTNINIRGAASKIFSYFIKEYKPKEIISYASCDISNGHLYETLGFKFIKHTGLNYWWVKNGVKYHRSNFMKHTLNGNKNLTENEIMRSNNYLKIYGCGNLKYEIVF